MSNPNWKNRGRGNTNDKLEDVYIGDECLTLEEWRRLEAADPTRGAKEAAKG